MLGSLVVLLISRTSCFLTTLHLPCGEKHYVTVYNTSKETLKTNKAGELPALDQDINNNIIIKKKL